MLPHHIQQPQHQHQQVRIMTPPAGQTTRLVRFQAQGARQPVIRVAGSNGHPPQNILIHKWQSDMQQQQQHQQKRLQPISPHWQQPQQQQRPLQHVQQPQQVYHVPGHVATPSSAATPTPPAAAVSAPATPDPAAATPAGGEPIIAYYVKHVFKENSKKVMKMPILINDQTIWVDCETIPPSGTAASTASMAGLLTPSENGAVLNLDDRSLMRSEPLTPLQHQQQLPQILQPHHVPQQQSQQPQQPPQQQQHVTHQQQQQPKQLIQPEWEKYRMSQQIDPNSTVPDKVESKLHNFHVNCKKASDEPVCIALSSDEEMEPDNNEVDALAMGNDDMVAAAADSHAATPNHASEQSLSVASTPALVTAKEVLGNLDSEPHVALVTRSIRVGSYKAMPLHKVFFTHHGMQLKVPGLISEQDIEINLKMSEIREVQISYTHTLPVIFLLVQSEACNRIQKGLNMNKKFGLWLDIDSKDETQRRLTIIPKKLTDENKGILMKIFANRVQKLDSRSANETLVKSTLKEHGRQMEAVQWLRAAGSVKQKASLLNSSTNSNSLELSAVGTASRLQQRFCSFPPSGDSSVTVTTEDYCCLEVENFLNDVIIDFYLRYLQYKIMSDVDRDRTHIFSTFFYKRLTTRPKTQKNRVHPVEDNNQLSAAEKRYDRVKRWTKKVNLFDKDFIVVPINEQSHWFVAVICYPGLVGCRRMCDDEAINTPASQQLRPKKASSSSSSRPVKGSTSIFPLKDAGDSTGSGRASSSFYLNSDDLSDRDEADADDDEMMDEEDLPAMAATTTILDSVVVEAREKEGSDKDAKNEPQEGQEEAKEEKEGKEKAKEVAGSEKEDKAEEEPKEKEKEKTVKNDADLNSSTAIKQPCILIFDSLNTGSRARVAATLRDYLQCEYKAKLNKERAFNKDTMKGNCPKVPQQPNFSDCGIYVLQYIESFFKNPLKDFTLPITSLHKMFSKDMVRRKRREIADLIQSLAGEQNPKKTFNFPNLDFTDCGAGYSDNDDDKDEEDEERRVVLKAKAKGISVTTMPAMVTSVKVTPANGIDIRAANNEQ